MTVGVPEQIQNTDVQRVSEPANNWYSQTSFNFAKNL